MVKTSLLIEMGLSDKERKHRLALLGVDRATRRELAKLIRIIRPHLPRLVDKWFDMESADPAMSGLLAYARSRGHLGPGMIHQLESMAAGRYGAAYFESRLKVGLIHERVGVEPSWYMGAWRSIADLIRGVLEESRVPPAEALAMLAAMERMVQFDQVLALDAYFHAKNSELVKAGEKLKKLAGELQKKNRKLSAQYKKVLESSRIKEEFLSRVSHELRTPLNSIIGYSDLLLDGIDGELSEEQGRSVGKMRNAGEILLSLIDGMISASRMAAAGVVHLHPFNIVEAVSGNVGKYAKEAAAKGLAFEILMPEVDFPHILGDEEAFILSLGRVLDNGIKFTERGGLKVGFCRAAEGVRVYVADTGPGVPPEERKKIFEAFHQVDGGDDRVYQGLGMGLTLAARAMKAMGGALDVSDAAGGGAMFCLWLPLSAE